MLLPLFILVGFIADYFVNAIAYHLSPLEDKTALTFRQVLVGQVAAVNNSVSRLPVLKVNTVLATNVKLMLN